MVSLNKCPALTLVQPDDCKKQVKQNVPGNQENVITKPVE